MADLTVDIESVQTNETYTRARVTVYVSGAVSSATTCDISIRAYDASVVSSKSMEISAQDSGTTQVYTGLHNFKRRYSYRGASMAAVMAELADGSASVMEYKALNVYGSGGAIVYGGNNHEFGEELAIAVSNGGSVSYFNLSFAGEDGVQRDLKIASGSVSTGIYRLTVPTSWLSYVPTRTYVNGGLSPNAGSSFGGQRNVCMLSYGIGNSYANQPIRLDVPSSYVPEIGEIGYKDGAGYGRPGDGVIDAFVRTLSDVRAWIPATATGGARISKIMATYGSLSATVGTSQGAAITIPTEESPMDLGTINDVGDLELKITVEDSRLRRSSKSVILKTAAYSTPTLYFQANRWDTTENEESDGSTTVRLSLTGAIAIVNNHVIPGTIVVKQREKNASSWTTVNTYSVSGNFSEIVTVSNQSIDLVYEYEATISDEFGHGSVLYASVGKATPILEFNATGKGIGIGTVAPETGLNIGMQLFMQNNLAFGGLTTADVPTTMLLLNSSDQVELNWTTGGLKGRVMKELWSGTWSSGNITVPELPYYNVFVILTKSNPVPSVPILAVRYNLSSTDDRIHGTNGLFEVSNNYMHLTQFQAAVKLSDPTILLPVVPNGIVRDQIPANASFWNVKLEVAKIYGIL